VVAWRVLLAELLLGAGCFEEAELHLAVALAAAPGDVTGQSLAGRARLDGDDPAAARVLFERALAGRERWADLWAWNGLVHLAAAEGAAAIAMLELAIARWAAGDGPGAVRALRHISLRQRIPAAFPKGFYRALADDPDDGALCELHRAAALHPTYPDLVQALARARRARAR
jgi:predicted TPR repeat methyltransferase